MAQSASEKAAERIETQRILREKGYFRTVEKDRSDARAAQAAEDFANGRTAEMARQTAIARHVAAMHDYTSGNALARAVENYKVRRAVVDVALADGRDANGRVLPEVKEIPASLGATPAQSDASPDAPKSKGKASKIETTPAQ